MIKFFLHNWQTIDEPCIVILSLGLFLTAWMMKIVYQYALDGYSFAVSVLVILVVGIFSLFFFALEGSQHILIDTIFEGVIIGGLLSLPVYAIGRFKYKKEENITDE